MSVTTGTFPGVRILDMPDLGAVADASSFVGELAGSGRFSAPALRDFILYAAPLTGPLVIAETQDDVPPEPLAGLTMTRDATWGGGPELSWTQLFIVNTMTGDDVTHEGPTGQIYPLHIRFYDSALRNLASTAGASQDAVITTQIFREPIPGGVPDGRRMRDIFGFWNAMDDTTNLPTSQSGNLVLVEHDMWFNNIDDDGGRILFQINCNIKRPLADGGYPASYRSAIYLQGAPGMYGQNVIEIGSAFSHAGIDMGYAGSAAPIITSASPGSPVRVITVDTILPLESGGTSGGPDIPVASTCAYVRSVISVGGGGATLTLNDVSYLKVGMFVYDTLPTSGVPGLTRIDLITGNVVSLSASTGFSPGMTVVFSRARKNVTINGNNHVVAGVVLAGSGSEAGTVYFADAVPPADAVNGAIIYPNAHSIWIPGGSDAAPWHDICFDHGGMATIRSDGVAGIKMTGTGLTLAGLLNFGGHTEIYWDDTGPGSLTVLSALTVGGTLYTASDMIVGGEAQFTSPALFAVGFGLFGSPTPAAKPVVTGAKGGNAALASLLSALASYGLILNSTS
jgi:hypothetical protein